MLSTSMYRKETELTETSQRVAVSAQRSSSAERPGANGAQETQENEDG